MWTFVLTTLSCGLAWIRALECGEYVPRVSTRSIGGQLARLKEFPWQVYIHPSGEEYDCGGAIISENWVLSAAHCFEELGKDEFDIRGGIRDISRYFGDRHEQRRKIERVVMHPAFASGGDVDHDIALVKLTEPFDFASSKGFIGPVCLPQTAPKVGGNLIVSGWGSTNESRDRTSRLLRRVEVPVVGVPSCRDSLREIWNASLGPEVDPESVVCAGFPDGGRDSCWGDSGGGAVQLDSGRAVLQGIVSWGEGCARPGKPGVYTAVLYFVPWIEEVISVE